LTTAGIVSGSIGDGLTSIDGAVIGLDAGSSPELDLDRLLSRRRWQCPPYS